MCDWNLYYFQPKTTLTLRITNKFRKTCTHFKPSGRTLVTDKGLWRCKNILRATFTFACYERKLGESILTWKRNFRSYLIYLCRFMSSSLFQCRFLRFCNMWSRVHLTQGCRWMGLRLINWCMLSSLSLKSGRGPGSFFLASILYSNSWRGLSFKQWQNQWESPINILASIFLVEISYIWALTMINKAIFETSDISSTDPGFSTQGSHQP